MLQAGVGEDEFVRLIIAGHEEAIHKALVICEGSGERKVACYPPLTGDKSELELILTDGLSTPSETMP